MFFTRNPKFCETTALAMPLHPFSLRISFWDHTRTHKHGRKNGSYRSVIASDQLVMPSPFLPLSKNLSFQDTNRWKSILHMQWQYTTKCSVCGAEEGSDSCILSSCPCIPTNPLCLDSGKGCSSDSALFEPHHSSSMSKVHPTSTSLCRSLSK